MWTASSTRPVHLVFEIDRFRVVHAVDVLPELLELSPVDVELMSWTGGPTLLAVRPFRDEREKMAATLMALQGVALSARPDLWQAYDVARPGVLAAARHASELRFRLSAEVGRIDAAVASTGRAADALVYLLLVGRKSFWTVLLDAANADVIGFVALDAF